MVDDPLDPVPERFCSSTAVSVTCLLTSRAKRCRASRPRRRHRRCGILDLGGSEWHSAAAAIAGSTPASPPSRTASATPPEASCSSEPFGWNGSAVPVCLSMKAVAIAYLDNGTMPVSTKKPTWLNTGIQPRRYLASRPLGLLLLSHPTAGGKCIASQEKAIE